MSQGALDQNRRILIVDDNTDIHADYRRVLNEDHDADTLAAAEAALFGDAPSARRSERFDLSHAYQGEEGHAQLSRETERGQPFALAFVDMRMPPGWDGLETIRRLWQADPRLQVVLCTAYSDYSWSEICDALSPGDRLLILKKPFDAVEVRQLAASLVTKWNLGRAAERSQRELERQVAERTRELQESKEAADRASQSKSDFLANISHEIRTPLTAILGFTRLLMDRPSREECAEYLQIIRASAEHQLTLINDLLDVSKIEAGQMHIHRVACSVPDIIDEVLQSLRFRADEKRLALTSELRTPLAEPIYSDPSRLRQLLINLVGNALKFTESGVVRVSAGSFNENGRRKLRIEVADTGIGIPAEKQQAIFAPFVQADSTIAPRFGGTGLGLAISRSIAGLLGGSLTVASREGCGSTFTLIVDAERPQTIDDSSALASGGTLPPTASALDGRRILLVEDHRYNRQLIELALSRAGALIDTAEDGQNGLARALSSDYDIVVMDMQMPIMDGYTATERLRAKGYQKPIIALTAHALPAERERCLRIGCDAFVAKPIDLDHLIAVIRQLLAVASPPAADSYSFAPQNDTDGDLSEVEQMLQEYVASLPETVGQLRDDFSRRAFDAIARTAHTLKGSGGTLGFPELSLAAEQLESALRSPSGDDVSVSLDQLAELVEQLQTDHRSLSL